MWIAPPLGGAEAALRLHNCLSRFSGQLQFGMLSSSCRFSCSIWLLLMVTEHSVLAYTVNHLTKALFFGCLVPFVTPWSLRYNACLCKKRLLVASKNTCKLVRSVLDWVASSLWFSLVIMLFIHLRSKHWVQSWLAVCFTGRFFVSFICKASFDRFQQLPRDLPQPLLKGW